MFTLHFATIILANVRRYSLLNIAPNRVTQICKAYTCCTKIVLNIYWVPQTLHEPMFCTKYTEAKLQLSMNA